MFSQRFNQGCGSGSGGSGPFSAEVEAEAQKILSICDFQILSVGVP